MSYLAGNTVKRDAITNDFTEEHSERQIFL
jgi:hypothetical protein